MNNTPVKVYQSLPEIITYEKDDSSLQLVIKVTFHQKENTYREWYSNNAKTHLNMLMIMRFSTDSCTFYGDQQSILNLLFHFGYFTSKRLKKILLIIHKSRFSFAKYEPRLPFSHMYTRFLINSKEGWECVKNV